MTPFRLYPEKFPLKKLTRVAAFEASIFTHFSYLFEVFFVNFMIDINRI